MINYILQVMLFQLIFLFIYDLFLKKETFFVENRIYLLCTPILSFFIPLVKLPSMQTEYTSEVSILLPEIVLSPQSVIEKSAVVQSMEYNYGAIIFWVGFVIFLSLFIVKFLRLNAMIHKSSVENYKKYRLVKIEKTRKAFSFFNYIFLGDEISEDDKRKVIKHEIVHSRQRHSLDLLFFEVLKAAMWFNPLSYIFQKRIATVHEFISDSWVTKTTPKDQYLNTLLNELFEVDNFSFVNQFSKKSMLKKRIMMMTKEKSKQILQAKYLILLPFLFAMLFYVSCSEEFQNTDVIAAEKQLQKIYFMSKDGLTESVSRDKESYLDYFVVFDINHIPVEWKEISESDLKLPVLNEYIESIRKMEEKGLTKKTSGMNIVYKLYRAESGRILLGMMSNFNRTAKVESIKDDAQDIVGLKDGVPFSIIDKIPTFPGCEENDKKCFNRNMQLHFANNFNTDLPNQLGLTSGKKRLIMMFMIDKNGEVTKIKVKSPAPELSEEAERVIDMLPTFTAGEHQGKPVSVKYTLPVRIDVK